LIDPGAGTDPVAGAPSGRPLRAVVGFGANLGDRVATMRAALRALAEVARVEKVSRVYETAPVGGPVQPAFFNAAALVVYPGEPVALLDELLAIEADLGRVRRERWGPRTIDLDILWIEGLVLDEPRLTVPHPRLRERAFGVVPLLDVAPDARDPTTDRPFAIPPGEIIVTGESLVAG
jgi:2-amino-4-hydroxy-6-hydroxymethyldihydropteridine diphosphokinase